MSEQTKKIIAEHPDIGETVELIAYKFDVDKSNVFPIGNEQLETKTLELATIALFSWDQLIQQNPQSFIEEFGNLVDLSTIFVSRLFGLPNLNKCQKNCCHRTTSHYAIIYKNCLVFASKITSIGMNVSGNITQ